MVFMYPTCLSHCTGDTTELQPIKGTMIKLRFSRLHRTRLRTWIVWLGAGRDNDRPAGCEAYILGMQSNPLLEPKYIYTQFQHQSEDVQIKRKEF